MDEQTQIKRDIAIKIKIKDILDGNYVKEEGWKPNYILTKYGENISRVNLIGVIVSDPTIEEKRQSFVLDDGSDRIIVRSFEDGLALSKFMLGDVINVIGKPKEYMGSKYIVPELIKIIDNKKWLEVRKRELELKEKKIAQKPIIQTMGINSEKIEEDIVENESGVENIINIIRKLDDGSGVFIENILIKANNKDVEKIIRSLIEQGDIFEVQPGKVKVLE